MEDWKDKEISLILPTFNEKNSIRKVIDNFSKLELFKEILVINTMQWRELVKKLIKQMH